MSTRASSLWKVWVLGSIGRLQKFVFFLAISLFCTFVELSHAQALAWGSLMLDGYDIRISGQDVGRGTFSQR